MGILGKTFSAPVRIDTLDEFFLIMRKSSGLTFDATLPHFHLYGTDICMAARQKMKACYAISAFSVHNTATTSLAPEFFECYWHIRRRWKQFLPIQASCIRISRWNRDLIVRRIKGTYFSLVGKASQPTRRMEDPRCASPLALS
jgi:hypothetical protein